MTTQSNEGAVHLCEVGDPAWLYEHLAPHAHLAAAGGQLTVCGKAVSDKWVAGPKPRPRQACSECLIRRPPYTQQHIFRLSDGYIVWVDVPPGYHLPEAS